jgi:DNA primase
MISKFDIQKLQDLPIEQVAGALGLNVSHNKALCPFHNDSNPSLTFHRGKNRYRCFVCDAHGGVIDLVMRYEHKTFLEACKWLSDSSGSIIDFDKFSNQFSSDFERSDHSQSKPFDASRYARFFERPWLNDEAKRFLFEERKLNARVVQWCRLTSWKDKQGVPWLQTPYYDREGKLIGIQNRNLIKGGSPRFRFPQGASCSIYNLPVLNLLKPGETLFIAEGCSDCWSLLSAGHKAIAIPSATLLTKKDKDLLLSLSSSLSLHFAMYPDQDEPGERLFLQLREVLPSLVRYQLPEGCKDFSDLYLLKR